MSPKSKPTIALVQGDATGIGPELCAKVLALDEVREAANIVLFSDAEVFARGCETAGLEHSPVPIPTLAEVSFNGHGLHILNLPAPGVAALPHAAVSKAAGEAVLDCYGTALDACKDGEIHGLCFMPFNKEAMHLAGLGTEDETQWARQRINHTGRVSEFNVIDGMWNARVTSHVALRDVADLITSNEVVAACELADRTLKAAGYERPRIAVAALNPHAGDGGNMGREEIDVIRPAVAELQRRQIVCEGPFPSDTLYLRVRDGDYDCAVSMYHDQGQIAIKLLGFHMGISVHAGLPFPMATPAHGTAFDIAGKNKANIEPSKRAFMTVATMASGHVCFSPNEVGRYKATLRDDARSLPSKRVNTQADRVKGNHSRSDHVQVMVTAR
jgi:4-hydroxythreonine-4-phosphate dehydrogenase